MIVQSVKGAVSIVVYGVLLAIGFRIGQKAYEYAETNAQEDLNKLVKLTKEKWNDYTRSSIGGKETGNQSAS
jgi:hypothetical protein